MMLSTIKSPSEDMLKCKNEATLHHFCVFTCSANENIYKLPLYPCVTVMRPHGGGLGLMRFGNRVPHCIKYRQPPMQRPLSPSFSLKVLESGSAGINSAFVLVVSSLCGPAQAGSRPLEAEEGRRDHR